MGGGKRNHALSVLARRPLLYAISPGVGAAGLAALERAAREGVAVVQVREKALSAPALLDACRRLRAALAGSGTLILVNERWDVALAAGLDGVHLPAAAAPAARVRALAPGLILGRSCHSAAAAAAAAAEGCDYCLLGPVYATPSKAGFGPPLGLDELARAARAPIPVLALGGVNAANAAACLERGAAGLAGIRLFDPGRGEPGAPDPRRL